VGDIWTMGEILVEIMRPRAGMALSEPGEFLGPFPSGAPAIFIDAVARLGVDAGIIGGVGQDGFGTCVVDRLYRDGVNVDWVNRAPKGSTAVAFVAYEEDGSRSFIYHIDNTPAVIAPELTGRSLPEASFFHVMGCSLMASDSLRQSIVETARRFHDDGARISLDPNIRVELLFGRTILEIAEPILRMTSVLLPGESELLLLAETNDVRDATKVLFDRYPLEVIAVKRGRRGASVFTPTLEFAVSPYVVEEVDPTGAGDCFDAGFLVGMSLDKDLEVCGSIAAAAGALNAAGFGPMEGTINPQAVAELAGIQLL
jgi:tagatose kinase